MHTNWLPTLLSLFSLYIFVSSDSFIVFLDTEVTHEVFEANVHGFNSIQYENYSFDLKVSHKYSHLAHGVAVSGSALKREHMLNMKGVLHVVPNQRRHLPRLYTASEGSARRAVETASGPPWGIDILDSGGVADGIYSPTFTGVQVDVYVVDTGIDTNHAEFKTRSGHTRIVKNIYNNFATNQNGPSANTDDVGHGTHVAGIIGGNNVGVARDVNILGVKVLDSKGEGEDSIILHGLDFVAKRVKSTEAALHGSILSMSLGGACATSDCANDPLNIFVEKLSKLGVLVSAASGNEGCNACFGAPNGATDAFVVGSLSPRLTQSYFSNFGQCIDVFAAGEAILSACSSSVCNAENFYVEEDGTSMAAPHVTGVLAQLLQKRPKASLADVYDTLACDAVKDRVIMQPSDTITRNMILQVPKLDATHWGDYCKVGSGCPANCSGHGACLLGETSVGQLEKYQTCFCDPGYWGNDCAALSNPSCSADQHYSLQVQMQDTFGDGWSFSKFAIVEKDTQQIADDAFDSLCGGDSDLRQYCLLAGKCYSMKLNRGDSPQENSWSACGMNGGSPSYVEFCVQNGQCIPQCNEGALVSLGLRDSGGDGWGGAYYAAYTPTGQQLAGGTLAKDLGSSDIHTLCIPNSCVAVLLELQGDAPGEVSLEACGATASASQLLHLCPAPDTAAGCTAEVLPTARESKDAGKPLSPCHPGTMSVSMAYAALETPEPVLFSLGNRTEVLSQFTESRTMCVSEGCHALNFRNTSASDAIWFMCGRRGTVPWSAQVCVEPATGECYGLSGCPMLRSAIHHASAQWFFLGTSDRGSEDYVHAFNAHGVHELCGVDEDTTYTFSFGFGAHNEGDTWRLCGREGMYPARGTVQFTGGLGCRVTSMISDTCDATEVSLLLAKLDAYGDGWGSQRLPGHFSVYHSPTPGAVGSLMRQGTLASGSYGVEALCLQVGQCYVLTVQGSVDVEEMFVLACGSMIAGAASTNSPEGARFCVTGPGACTFDGKKPTPLTDDDFLPAVATVTSAPSEMPTLGTAPTPVPSAAPSAPAGQRQVLQMAFICRLTLYTDEIREIDKIDLRFLVWALQHTLQQVRVQVWDASVLAVVTESAPAAPPTDGSLPRRLGLEHDPGQEPGQRLFPNTILCAFHVQVVMPLESTPSEASAAVRFLLHQAKSDGTLQRDIDQVIAALLAHSQDPAWANLDGRSEAQPVHTPLKSASLLLLTPDPAAAEAPPAVFPCDDQQTAPAAHSTIYSLLFPTNVKPDLEQKQSPQDQSGQQQELKPAFPLGQLLVLTTLASSMLLLYLYYQAHRYRIPLVRAYGGRQQAGDYTSVSLVGSSHSTTSAWSEDSDGSPLESEADSKPIELSASRLRGRPDDKGLEMQELEAKNKAVALVIDRSL